MTKNELIKQFENDFFASRLKQDEKGEYLDSVVFSMWCGFLSCAEKNGIVSPGTSLEDC